MQKKFKLKRTMTHDAAFQYRMGSGFSGDVNRTHPAWIEPTLIDAALPPTFFGQAVLIDATTQGIRPYKVSDQSDTVASTTYGMLVRPFPFQAPAGSSNSSQGLVAGTPPTSGLADVMRSGYGMVQLNVGVAAPVKGATVYVWCAATSGNHVQGGYETAYSSGNTVALGNNTTFQGGADANGIAEISFNV